MRVSQATTTESESGSEHVSSHGPARAARARSGTGSGTLVTVTVVSVQVPGLDNDDASHSVAPPAGWGCGAGQGWRMELEVLPQCRCRAVGTAKRVLCSSCGQPPARDWQPWQRLPWLPVTRTNGAEPEARPHRVRPARRRRRRRRPQPARPLQPAGPGIARGIIITVIAAPRTRRTVTVTFTVVQLTSPSRVSALLRVSMLTVTARWLALRQARYGAYICRLWFPAESSHNTGATTGDVQVARLARRVIPGTAQALCGRWCLRPASQKFCWIDFHHCHSRQPTCLWRCDCFSKMLHK